MRLVVLLRAWWWVRVSGIMSALRLPTATDSGSMILGLLQLDQLTGARL